MSCTEAAYVAIGLRTSLAMPGTEIAHVAIGLRACYAMSGTEIAYANTSDAIQTSKLEEILQVSTAMSGTEIADGAICHQPTREIHAIQLWYGAVCAVGLRAYYAMPGTDLAVFWDQSVGLAKSEEQTAGEILSPTPALRDARY
eukprot:2746304-Rhodomonas_salina.3